MKPAHSELIRAHDEGVSAAVAVKDAMIAALVDLIDKTAKMLEDESPGLKEVGYWNADEKALYEKVKASVKQ